MGKVKCGNNHTGIRHCWKLEPQGKNGEGKWWVLCWDLQVGRKGLLEVFVWTTSKSVLGRHALLGSLWDSLAKFYSGLVVWWTLSWLYGWTHVSALPIFQRKREKHLSSAWYSLILHPFLEHNFHWLLQCCLHNPSRPKPALTLCCSHHSNHDSDMSLSFLHCKN